MPEPTLYNQGYSNRDLLESLRGDLCPACGGGKVPRQTLCRACYGRLPKPLGLALYRPIYPGPGRPTYGEAFVRAMVELECDLPQFPPRRERNAEKGVA